LGSETCSSLSVSLVSSENSSISPTPLSNLTPMPKPLDTSDSQSTNIFQFPFTFSRSTQQIPVRNYENEKFKTSLQYVTSFRFIAY